MNREGTWVHWPWLDETGRLRYFLREWRLELMMLAIRLDEFRGSRLTAWLREQLYRMGWAE